MTRKIIAEKSEGVAEIIDRVLEEPGREAILVIPKGSSLGKSARNFHLLKREMDSAGRVITIESVDEDILAFAKESGFIQSHPLFREGATRGISDIVPTRQIAIEEESEEEIPEPLPEKRRSVASKRKTIPVQESVEEESNDREDDGDEEEEMNAPAGKETFFSGDRFFKERPLTEIEAEEDNREGRRLPWKWIGVIIIVVVIVGIALYGVTALFGHVEIAINFKQTPWQYNGAITANVSTANATVNASGNAITVQAQLFKPTQNITQLFPATAEENVSLKAQGMLTIYNAYSSAPQTLVATTRFVTPSGLIFRLEHEVIVPGAQVTNGAIVPSSINTPVIADQPGPSYNIGPVTKLTVPGFANTPKEQGFYGALASSTSGGFIGQKAVPSTADISSAKAKMTSLLNTDLENSLAGSYPNNFKILSDATNITITKLSVNTTTDQTGNFSVFGEATLEAIGFNEAALKSALLQQAQTTEPSSTFSSLTLQYGSSTPNFAAGTISFPLSATGSLEPAFSPSDFDASVSGKSISDARAAVAGLPELSDGSISVWPSWLWSIPSNSSKIDITVK